MKEYPYNQKLSEEERRKLAALNTDLARQYRSSVEWGLRVGLLRHRGKPHGVFEEKTALEKMVDRQEDSKIIEAVKGVVT